MLYKKSLFTICLLIPVIFICSCNNNPHPEAEKITLLNFEKGLQQTASPKLSAYCSTIEYIPLETNVQSVISFVLPHRMEFGNDCAYIIDPMSKQCKRFDKTGKYLGNIGNIGNGPGEFRNPAGPYTDLKTGEVFFFESRQLFRFTSDGSFLQTIPLDNLYEPYTFIRKLIPLGSEGFSGVREYPGKLRLSFIQFDLTGKLTYQYHQVNNANSAAKNGETIRLDNGIEVIATSNINYHTYTYNNGTYLFSPLNDTIFVFYSKDKKKPGYRQYWGKYTETTTERKNKNYSRLNTAPIETDAAIFFNFSFNTGDIPYLKPGTQKGAAIYDKTNRTLSAIAYDPHYDATGLQNDLDNGAPFWPEKIAGNKLYKFLNAAEFIRLSEKSNSAPMKKVAATLTEHSNPVMIVATLK